MRTDSAHWPYSRVDCSGGSSWGGRSALPGWQTPPPSHLNKMTHACENITFQTSLRYAAGKYNSALHEFTFLSNAPTLSAVGIIFALSIPTTVPYCVFHSCLWTSPKRKNLTVLSQSSRSLSVQILNCFPLENKEHNFWSKEIHYPRKVTQTWFIDRRFTFEDIFGSDFVIMTPTVIQSLSCTSDDFVFMCNRDNLITFLVAIRAFILISGISGFLEISKIGKHTTIISRPDEIYSPFDYCEDFILEWNGVTVEQVPIHKI